MAAMNAAKFRQTAKWALIALVCAALLTACGTKPAPDNGQNRQGAAGGGNPPAGQKADGKDQDKQTAHKTWDSPPEMTIDTNKTYHATVNTSMGSFKIELFAKEAPLTVNNFVFLAKEKFYDDVIIHRIIETFMIQTGDPLGNGTGGPGYRFKDELDTGFEYEPGIVAMANSGKNTNGSQFFICTGEASKGLNKKPDYSIFGKVVEGMDVVLKIAAAPVQYNPMARETSSPIDEIFIQSVDITES